MKNKIMILGLLVIMGCASLIPLKVGPPQDIMVEITPERLTRGEYLANHVTGCPLSLMTGLELLFRWT